MVAIAELLVSRVAEELQDEATGRIDRIETLWETTEAFLCACVFQEQSQVINKVYSSVSEAIEDARTRFTAANPLSTAADNAREHKLLRLLLFHRSFT